MRIAVCFGGQTRLVTNASRNIKNYLKEVNYDVFIHTWSNLNSVPRLCYGMANGSRPYYPTEPIDHVVDLYNPKKILVEDWHEVAKLKNFPVTHNIHIPIYYSYNTSFDLLKKYEQEHNIRYDIVLQMRFDMIYDPERSVTTELSLLNLRDNVVLVDPWFDSKKIATRNTHDTLSVIAEKMAYLEIYNNPERGHDLDLKTFFNEYGLIMEPIIDRRFTFLRNTENYLDSLLHFDQIRYSNSISEGLELHMKRHWQWYYNPQDSDWQEKMNARLISLLGKQNGEYLISHFEGIPE